MTATKAKTKAKRISSDHDNHDDNFSPVFQLGRVVITPGAIATMDNLFGDQARQKTADLVARHAAGDDGDLSPEDKKANVCAMLYGDRIFSSYRLADGATADDEDAPRLWIITEAKGDDGDTQRRTLGHRYSTCIMTPSEY